MIIVAAAAVVLFGFAVSTGETHGRALASLSSSERAVAIYLHDKGLDNVHVAAIMGNIQQESRFDATSSTSVAAGLCQWGLGVDGDRGGALKRWAASIGRDWSWASTQLDWLWAEMAHEGPAADAVGTARDAHGSLAAFLACDSVDDTGSGNATAYFERWIEGAGTPMLTNRVAYAQRYLQVLDEAW